MKKLISNFVEVEGNFVKGTNIVTGFKTIESVEKKQHLSKRKIIGKVVKEDKFCNSKYKYNAVCLTDIACIFYFVSIN